MAVGSTGYLPQIDYVARDYAQIRAALITHTQNFFPNDFQDFSESNLGICILELNAYVGDQLNFYLDRVVNEMFLPTVVQRANAVNLVALLGYVPRTVAAAVAPIQLTLEIAQTGTVTIPAYTSFTDSAGNIWEFLENLEIPTGRTDTINIQVTDENTATSTGATTYTLALDNANLVTNSFSMKMTIHSILYNISASTDGVLVLPFGGTGLVDFLNGSVSLIYGAADAPDVGTSLLATYQWNQNIRAYQGETRLEQFTSTGQADQSFTITQTPILVAPRVLDDTITPDPSRIEVWIGDPGAPYGTSSGTLWRRVDSLVSGGSAEEVYSITLDDQDRVSINFGDNLNGKVPAVGTINIIYRQGGGTEGNVATGFISTTVTGLVGLFATTVTLLNYEPATGGAERESLDEIRVNAPAFFRTNDTATTEQDYDALALYSQSGLGAVTRAKSRLTPASQLSTKVVHSALILGTVPITTPLEYYLLLPGAPTVVSTVTVSYDVGAVTRNVTATDLGSGLANLTGDATVDSTLTRWRYDEQDIEGEFITGFTGNGTQVTFTGTLAKFPVFPGSVLFSYNIGGTSYIGYDDGSGTLVGTLVHADSTINYNTGAVALHFGTPGSITSGNAETYDFNAINGGGAVDLFVNVDGSGIQTINFVAGDAVAYAAVTAAEVVAVLMTGGSGGGGNALVGATANESAASVRITSDTYGVTSIVDIDAGANDANDALGFSLTAVAGVSSPIAASANITFDYQSCLRLVLLFVPDSGSEITISAETGPNLQTFPTNNIEVYTWSTGADGAFEQPTAALRDNLKAYLDLRRVLGTSIEVLPGRIFKLHYHLTVTFDPAISSTDTSAAIVTALESYFDNVVNVNAGSDVPLAAIYDALWPIGGILKLVVQDVGILLEVGVGTGSKALFKDNILEPGQFIPQSRLPIVSGASNTKVRVGTVIAGNSDATAGTTVFQGTGGTFTTLSGSTLTFATGDFTVKLSPAPALNEKVYIEFLLDEAASADGVALWDIESDEWEIPTLGDVMINGSKVN